MKRSFKKMFGSAFIIVLVIAAVMIGCSKKKTINLTSADLVSGTVTVTPTITTTATAGSGTPTATATTTAGSTSATYPMGWIDDCEDGASADTGNVCDFNGDTPVSNVGGYWITFDDDDWSIPGATAGKLNCTVTTGYSNCGTSYVWPMSQGWATRMTNSAAVKFTMSAPGYGSSVYGHAYCARITGYVTTNAIPGPNETQYGFQYGFIGMGVQLTSTAGSSGGCQHVDIRRYTGVKFYAKSTSNSGSGASFVCKLPYTPTTNCDDPLLGTLDKFNDYKVAFTATSTWTLFTLPFSNFKQETGWGTIVPQSDVLQNASAIQWQTDGQKSYFLYPNAVDLEIDDVQLYY